MFRVPKLSKQATMFQRFALNRDSLIVGGSVLLTGITTSFLAPYVSRLPKVGQYMFAMYLVMAFVVFLIAGMFGGGLIKAVLQGISLGLLWQGIMTIPAVGSFKARLDNR